MRNNKKLGIFLKYLSYSLIIILLYLIQTAPQFLSIYGVKPNLLYPVAVVIAMCEGEFTGGIFGALAGMLCDLSSYNNFGFNSILLLILSVSVGLLVIYLMKNSKTNSIILTASVLIIRGLMEYFFVYFIWGYENTDIILLQQIIPTIIYSLIFTVPLHIVFNKLYVFFDKKYNI